MFANYDPPQLRLRAWRRNRGLTLNQVAERAGLNLHTVSRLENHRHKPRAETLQGIAAALELTPFDLYRDPSTEAVP